MRKHWLDNLRWFVVLLVPLQHVFYMFNSKGAYGSIGAFCDDPLSQPQDLLLYIFYPWKMMLLFLLAGMSARYSLRSRTVQQYIGSRTLKLLVTSTLGLFVFHWISGYFNVLASPAAETVAALPFPIRWVIYSLVGFGPMWFVQDLWLFSMLLLLVRKLDPHDKFWALCSKSSPIVILSLGLLVYATTQTMVFNPSTESITDGIINLYRPLTYFTLFLMGYFVFSHDSVLAHLRQMALPTTICAIVVCVPMCYLQWGKCYSDPEVVAHPLTCLYAWLSVLAAMGIAMRIFDYTDAFCRYMNRISFGVYALHYPVTVGFAYLFKRYWDLSPWVVYPAMLLLVYLLPPVLYEVVHRIPFVRWAVLGEKGEVNAQVGHNAASVER